MDKNRKLFLLFWSILLTTCFVTVFKDISFVRIISSPRLLTNILQRLLGLLVFLLFFVQIVLGAFMNKWVRYFGGWIFRFHIFEGLLAYGLLVLHPVFYLANIFLSGGNVTFSFFLPKISPPFESFLTAGKVSFILISVSVFAAYFRTLPILRNHWRKFHMLNYFTFFLIFFHSFNLGSDVRKFPFSFIYYSSIIIFLAIFCYKLIEVLRLVFSKKT